MAVHSLYATLARPPDLPERAASFLFPLEGREKLKHEAKQQFKQNVHVSLLMSSIP
jgi:hypothetical protein